MTAGAVHEASAARASGGPAPAFEAFEESMRRGVRLWLTAAAVALPAGAAGSLLAWRAGHEAAWWPIAAAFFSVLFLDMGISRSWRGRFKREIVAPLVPTVGDGLRYAPRGVIPRGAFEASRLFLERLDDYRGEDLVEGRVGETSVAVCDVHATRIAERGLLGTRLLAKWADVFRGLFLVADFNKKLASATLVVPERDPVSAEKRSKALAKRGDRPVEPVSLEDPEFERWFRVMAQDQVEARFVLSPSFMERLVQLRRATQDFHVAFVGSRMYLAIPSSRDRLEPPDPYTIWRRYGIENVRRALREAVGGFLEELRFGREVVEALNLNLRIWGRGPWSGQNP